MRKKILMLVLLLTASCSYYDKSSLYEISNSKKEIKHEVNKYVNESNEKILQNENLYKEIFNKNHRKINKNLKAVWVSSVLNLDFPSKANLSKAEMIREIDEIVENVSEWGMNAIFFQVKPTAAVLYKSSNLPWSSYLTGKEGVDPGFDPLAYFIKKAHEKNIELHAWINPYRVSMGTDYTKLANNNIAKLHPDWVFEYGNRLYLNPSKPGVVEYLYKNIEEIVRNYDVDGIHLDDYFYPYPDSKNSKLPNFDINEYKQYGSAYNSIGDFRRNNVDELVKNLSVSVHKIKPHISFGISPFGIWRNKKDDILGSNTNGLSAYDTLYADVLKWMENGWLDYVVPQIYWEIGHEKADYEVLVKWWNDLAKRTNTVLYIGEGIYKATNWKLDELKKHKEIRNNMSNVNGYILFRYKTLKENLWMIDEVR